MRRMITPNKRERCYIHAYNRMRSRAILCIIICNLDYNIQNCIVCLFGGLSDFLYRWVSSCLIENGWANGQKIILMQIRCHEWHHSEAWGRHTVSDTGFCHTQRHFLSVNLSLVDKYPWQGNSIGLIWRGGGNNPLTSYAGLNISFHVFSSLSVNSFILSLRRALTIPMQRLLLHSTFPSPVALFSILWSLFLSFPPCRYL